MAQGRFLNLSVSLFELTKAAIIILVVLALFAVLVGLPLLVNGESMLPNFQSRELVIVEQISYFGNRAIQRGDVVAAKFPAEAKKTRLIKRVIGLPGEHVQIESGVVMVNGQSLDETAYKPVGGEPPYDITYADITLKDDEYFLMGDNRPGSSDSRLWGPVVRSDILGKVSFVVWPPSAIRFVDRPSY